MNSVQEEICSAKACHSPRMLLLLHNYFFGTVEDGLNEIAEQINQTIGLREIFFGLKSTVKL